MRIARNISKKSLYYRVFEHILALEGEIKYLLSEVKHYYKEFDRYLRKHNIKKEYIRIALRYQNLQLLIRITRKKILVKLSKEILNKRDIKIALILYYQALRITKALYQKFIGKELEKIEELEKQTIELLKQKFGENPLANKLFYEEYFLEF